MPKLTWTEGEVARELVGALTSVASLCAHRPEVATALRASVVRRLDPAERDLVRRLYDEIEDTTGGAADVEA